MKFSCASEKPVALSLRLVRLPIASKAKDGVLTLKAKDGVLTQVANS